MKKLMRRALWFSVGLCWTCLVWFPAFGQTNTNTVTVTAEVQSTNGVRSVSAVVRNLEQQVYFTFGLKRIPVLQRTLFGVPLYQYAASLIYVFLAFYFSKFLDYLVGTQLKRWASRTKTRLDDLVIGLIHGPIKIITFVILLHIGLQVFPWPAWIAHWISKGLLVIVACSVTYMLLKCADIVVEYWGSRARAREDRIFNEQLFPVIRKSLKAFVIVVAALVTTQNLGLDITAMLASLSIGGLALGLAAQDTVANLFGAVAVFVDKPFRVGDRIKLDSIDGTVESIGLRSTRVRSLDGYLVTVPNKTMGNATITNVTRRPTIKTELNIGITYDMPAEKVQRALDILTDTFRKHPMTADLVVGFNRFADSALNINVVHWWRGTNDHKAYVQGMQEMNLAIKKQFDAEGIEFAFPTQTLYVKRDGDPLSALAPGVENPPTGRPPAARG